MKVCIYVYIYIQRKRKNHPNNLNNSNSYNKRIYKSVFYHGCVGNTVDKRRIVILKYMFDPEESRSYLDPFEFYDGIRCEVGAEVERQCGFIEKLTVFEGSPEGVIAVKFAEAISAETCITQFDGRWFAFRQLSAAYFDGTDYRVRETDAESQQRVEEFGAWLLNGEENTQATAEAAQTRAANAQAGSANASTASHPAPVADTTQGAAKKSRFS